MSCLRVGVFESRALLAAAFMWRIRKCACLVLAGAWVSCTPTEEPRSAAQASVLPRPHFELTAPDGERLSSKAFRGRVSLLLLLTTHDAGSQLIAKEAQELMHTVAPRINVGAIIMEEPAYSVLLAPFKEGLGLTYPVVMADAALLSGGGPFGAIGYLPTLLVLDREGFERERIVGAATQPMIEDALERAREPR